MSPKPSDLNSTTGLQLPTEELTAHRQSLALDALLKLTTQFADKPDFKNLVQTMLLTLAGQFSVSSSFALLRNPSDDGGETFFTATGKFAANQLLQSLTLPPEMNRYFQKCAPVCLLQEIEIPDHCRSYGTILRDAGVELICPLVHGDKLMGLVGLGARVSRKSFGSDDLKLLRKLIGNIIPLLASSYFFQEMKDLSAWHVDILNNVKQSVFVFNVDNRLLKVNTAGLKMLASHMPQTQAETDPTGMSIEEVFPEQIFTDWCRRFIKATAEGFLGEIDNLTILEESDEHVYEAHLSSISGGSDSRSDFIATIDDVTERVLADQALRESKELLVATVESTADGILVVDSGGKVIYSNSRFALMWGIPVELIANREDEKLIAYVLDQLEDPEGFLALVGELYESDKQSFDTVRLKNDRSFERFSVPLIRDGKMDGRVWNFRDISERLQEEKLRDTLREQLDRAERMESLGVLAGGVAHDLNNMLGPMVGYPDLMLLKLAQDDPMRKQVQRIGESAKQAASVVQDLLSLARRGRYEMVPTDLNDVVTSYLDSRGFMRLKEDHPEVKVKIVLGERLEKINGSSSHLMKTVMNLVVNAFDAMADGGELTVSTSVQHVTELLGGHADLEPGNYVLLRVRDTGVGIDAGDLKRIFEPYFSRKTMGSSGSGLGLSVVYGVVKDHKGFYDLLSLPGMGTEFIFYFPVIQIDEKPRVRNKENYTGSETILIVDDVEDQREMASELLASQGYQTRVAVNGHDAVEQLRNDKVDLVVLDMIMESGFDGLDTYQEIIKLHPTQKAIVVSGYSVTERVEEMKKLGAGQYVKKPFTLDEIGKAVREELDRVTSAQ